ncbi:kelch-like protein 21 [Acipenser oxyrinchus oxyrinchus]|uniref:Kelch-like protein 21 n=1 Tax=Acipenser oxyrinchus oxyrinchus TaxID=40147 RepID=A0AAD8FZK1_ACIOX|nr:kelch-like protein 21 [Acipenser oxyrinchus oxyrinchus]
MTLVTQSSTLPFFDSAHALNLLRGIHELRAERKFFDVTLCAEGREFPCHRTVLAAASNYFKAMFAGTLRESGMDRVELHEVSAAVLGLLVDFCYTGRATVSHENVDPLLKGADLFQGVRLPGLAESARRFALRNIVELAKGPDFERLPLKRLLELVSDDRLCVDKEETAYLIAARWVKADPQRRLHFWPELFQRVRLPFVRRYFLLAHSARVRPARPPCGGGGAPSTGLAEILVVIGGCDQDCDELVTVDCYNPHTGHWRYLAEFPEHLGGGYSISALGNDMYVTGGSDGSRLYDCVWRYNSSVNEWTEVSPMLKPREYHTSCVLKGQLYVVASDSTERYDHSLDAWEPLLPMLHPMDNCSTTACRGRLYATGCLAGQETMVIQCYDPDSGRWSLVNCGPLPPWSFAPKTVALDGLIYFVRDDSAEVDVFNPLKNEWDAIPRMTQSGPRGGSVARWGKLFVSGGYDDTFELSDVVEAYDPSTGTWSRAARLPQPTFWHGSVSIFRQFMPSAPSGFESGLDNANNEINTIHLHRHHHHPHRAQALLDRNHNLNQVH